LSKVTKKILMDKKGNQEAKRKDDRLKGKTFGRRKRGMGLTLNNRKRHS